MNISPLSDGLKENTDCGSLEVDDAESVNDSSHIIAEAVPVTQPSPNTASNSSDQRRPSSFTLPSACSIDSEDGMVGAISMPDRRPFRRPSERVTSSPSCIIS